MDNQSLLNHALLTISTLERFLKNRGWTTGLKKWEQELLISAYQSAEINPAEWKFNLKPNQKVEPQRYF